VAPGSASARGGIRPRDLIVDVNGKPVRGVKDFRDAMDKSDVARGLRLQVKREGNRLFVFLKSAR
jgi:S1-C subfamily serine protease